MMDDNLMQKNGKSAIKRGDIIDKLKDNQKTPMCYSYLWANLKMKIKIYQTMVKDYLMKQTKWKNQRWG